MKMQKKKKKRAHCSNLTYITQLLSYMSSHLSLPALNQTVSTYSAFLTSMLETLQVFQL